MIRWLRAHRALAAFGLSYYVLLLVVGVVSGNGQTPIYAAFMALLFALVILADRGVGFSDGVLWGLAVWGLLHMCGGLVPVGGGRVLYEVWLLPVLRFDHVVHAVGFGFAGLACWEAASRAAPGAFTGWRAVPVVVLGGTGLGALNEMVEFLISQAVADTNVGGFENTGWDLVANLVGCVVAGLWVARATWAPPPRAPPLRARPPRAPPAVPVDRVSGHAAGVRPRVGVAGSARGAARRWHRAVRGGIGRGRGRGGRRAGRPGSG